MPPLPKGRGKFGSRGVVQILRGVRTIFLGPLTEGAVERMRDWGSLTFNTPSVGYADTSLTREARVLCGFCGDTVGAAICRPREVGSLPYKKNFRLCFPHSLFEGFYTVKIYF